LQPGYRRDIDGLRAVAVLGVVLYHYGFGWLPAGFAGVDVFFAISGFLIGGIILDELAEGRFSFRRFYMRRVRRILPALYVMMLATILPAALVMSPSELRYFGGGIFAALLFVSNIWFFNLIDYFNPGAALDPMVHTWSLGVEEQFYFVAPLALVLLGRLRRGRTLAVIAAVAALSLALMLAVHATRTSAAFYLIHYRAWELLLGVLAAATIRRGRLPFASAAPVLSSLGLIAIVGGFLLTPHSAVWPGLWTAIPVGGTVLVLLYGTAPSPARAVLSWAPMVGVGLISYSLYLYHQPLYSLALLAKRAESLSLDMRLALLAPCLVLATLSWRFVEEPFRHGRLNSGGGRRLIALGALVLAAFAIGGHVTEGYPQRLPEDARRAIAYEDSLPPNYEACAGGRLEGETLDPKDACVHGADVPPRIAVWGDSHAATLAQPIGAALAGDGLSVREYTLGGCPPILGVMNILQLTDAAVSQSEYCSLYTSRVLDHIRSDPGIEVVVLFAYWNNYTERRDFVAGPGLIKPDKLFTVPVGGDAAALTDDQRQEYLRQNLQAVVDALVASGKKVLLIYPMPEAPFNVPQVYAWSLWKGTTQARDRQYPAAVFEDYSLLSRAMLDAVTAGSGLARLDVSDGICTAGGACTMVDDAGRVLFRDSNHLSLAGSARIVPRIHDAVLELIGGGG